MKSKFPSTVAIIGQGYVGLPLAMTLTESNWQVIGVDLDQKKIELLISGISPVEDVQNDVLSRFISEGKYMPTSDVTRVSEADVIVICVPTPLDQDQKPDLSILIKAIRDISPNIRDESLIINESTSFPGTLRDIVVSEVLKFSKIHNPKFYFAVSPERVNPGDKIWNQKNTPRLVAGMNRIDTEKAIDFYRTFCDKVIIIDSPEVAEAAKLLENTFRLINIAAINEFAQVCYAAKLDVNLVIDAAMTKPYGFMPFRPSAGIGGHCIPVDPIYLSQWANGLGQKLALLEGAIEVNRNTSNYIGERVKDLVENIHNAKILIAGIGYKRGVGDTRESPAEELFEVLENFGFKCKWYDPLVEKWLKDRCTDLSEKFDAAVIVTNQPGMDISPLLINKTPILDCTNSYKNIEGIHSL
jgi:UDP-N-acetyl-D-glucosamine dehydrogenase